MVLVPRVPRLLTKIVLLAMGLIKARITLTADTNVGIGTSAPSKRLEVGTSAVADGINLFGTAPAYFLSSRGNTGVPNERGSLAFAGSAGLYSTDGGAGDIGFGTNSGRRLLE